MSGLTSHLAGLAAEEAVARYYCAAGAEVLARRWRCDAGEIDLVLATPAETVFVEVKAARRLGAAAWRVSAAQQMRLLQAAQVWLDAHGAGLDSACRFDVALVTGIGQVEVIENAFP